MSIKPRQDGVLRIVHVISGLGQGGAETVLHRLVTAATQPDEHIVISMGDEGVFGPRLRAAGIAVHTLDMKAGAITGLWRLFRLLRDLRPDVVQTWMYHADLIAGVVARLAGVKAVSWGIRNSGADLNKGSQSARTLLRISAPLSGVVPQLIIACANDAAARHRSCGYRADRMLVIPNGYDLSRWHRDPAARSAVRNEWGLADSTPVIGSVARWNPLKDHATLIHAYALTLKSHPELRCVLIGPDMDAANTELMALLDRHGVRERTILMGSRDDVPRLMNGLDVHVLSSRAEGFPNVVAEAMASGVACVVTDVGDAAAIVGGDGWVAPPRNPHALSVAIGEALSDLGTSQHASRLAQGRASVEVRYSLEAMVQAYHLAWRRLADDFPRAERRVTMPTRLGRKRLLFVVNNPAFFLSHRVAIAQEAQRADYDVHVATMDGAAVSEITALGFTHHVIPMSRSGRNPAEELATLFTLWRLFRRLQPDLVHAVTIKPVLYGGIAARLAGVPAFVAAVSGLGFIFMRGTDGFDFLRTSATTLYRLALGHRNSRVIFQNESDRDVLMRAGVVRAGQAVMIRGSGVDLAAFPMTPESDGPVRAIMVSRLLKDKGVVEFVEAARLAAERDSSVKWVLAGAPDPGNPASISDAEFAAWKAEGTVECLGERRDVAALYGSAHIAVLPSYREGLPKSLVEAAACGRAVVTTDVPGCRDAIQPGVSGLLVPARDARALAEAVLHLAADAPLRRQMGESGRRLAESEFDIRRVVQAHLAIYAGLTKGPTPL